jgi:superfamily I DNA/RNA helicase
MNDQNFPGIKKYDNQNPSKHEVYLNKKRKELFVALTRAAETLSISYPEIVEGQDQTPSMLLTGLSVKTS